MAEAEIGMHRRPADTSPLTDGEEILVDTPYGFPSAPITVGQVAESASPSFRGA